MIPYGRQDITKDDLEAVLSVLKSDFLTQGPLVPRFEKAFIKYCQVKHAVAVNSATSALHIACLALGLGKDDILWTTPVSFVASANCALYCGASVDFVDIDQSSYNICPIYLEAKLKQARQDGNLPKVLVAVHLAGQSCDMEKIAALAKEYNFAIIEDASHAVGGKYKGAPIGNCRYSDITVFSFHPVKIITTAEGGLAVTNSPELAEKMQLLRSHGITRDEGKMTQKSDGPWYYQQVELGFNYRMTELQAALGLSQFDRLDHYVKERHRIAEIYNSQLTNLPITLHRQDPDCYSAYHLYIIRLNLNEIEKTHHDIFCTLRDRGIGVNLHYIPIHLQPYYARMGFKQGDYPNAERYYEEALSLPLFPGLSKSDLSKVINSVKEVITQ